MAIGRQCGCLLFSRGAVQSTRCARDQFVSDFAITRIASPSVASSRGRICGCVRFYFKIPLNGRNLLATFKPLRCTSATVTHAAMQFGGSAPVVVRSSSLLPAMLSLMCIAATTGVVAAALTGDNVCYGERTHVELEQQRVQHPVRVRSYNWCLSLPPRCSNYRTEMREVTRLQVSSRRCTQIEYRSARRVGRTIELASVNDFHY